MLTELARDPWLVRQRPNPRARLRLFCLPFAGGGASSYRGWSAQLPPDVEVVAIQLPGREERLRETPFRDVADLVPVLGRVLAPWLDRPFALFGHSMGALIAFELARTLREPTPVHVFVSAHCGPRKPHCLAPIEAMPDQELIRILRRLGRATDTALEDAELMELMLPLVRADLTLCERYRYQPGEPLDCPVSAFGGTLDEFVRRADLTPWRDETRGRFDLRMFPGGHFFLEEARPRLLQNISESLGSALRHSSTARPDARRSIAP